MNVGRSGGRAVGRTDESHHPLVAAGENPSNEGEAFILSLALRGTTNRSGVTVLAHL